MEFNSFMDFTKSINDRDINTITQVVNMILEAIDNGDDKVVIFSTPDMFGDEVLSFTVRENQYKHLLKRAIIDFESNEMYEDCSIISEYLSKL